MIWNFVASFVISATLPHGAVSLEKFMEAYATHDLKVLDAYFDEKAIWEGPLLKLSEGREAFKQSYEKFYSDVLGMKIVQENYVRRDLEEIVTWRMDLRHRRINGSDWIEVKGMSRVLRNPNGKVISHRNFFDTGPVLYQSIPFVGWIIRMFTKSVPHDRVPPLLK